MADFTVAGLRVVGAVAATGSFTAAAEALGYTQSAVSRQIAAMESAAGSALFVRGARGVRLSPAGEVLVRHTTRVLGELDAVSLALAGMRDRLAGRLTLGVFQTAGAVLAPRAIAALAAEHPGLAVALDEAPTPTLIQRVRGGRIEIAVVAVGEGLPDYDLDGLLTTTLTSGDLRIAVPEGHRLTRRRRIVAADLERETWVVGGGNPGEPQFGPWPTLSRPRIGHTARSLPTRLGLVAAGLGIAVLPGLAAASVPAGVRVLPVEDPGRRGRSALAVTRTDPSAAASAMLRALREVASSL